MYINWNLLAPGPAGTVMPTYGNYGGNDYTAGRLVDSPFVESSYAAHGMTAPVDALDTLFQAHDAAYSSSNLDTRAAGDLALVNGIEHLHFVDPEASLYGGAALLFGTEQVAIADAHPNLMSQGQREHAATIAVRDIEYGLSHLRPSDVAGLKHWLDASHGSLDTALANATEALDTIASHASPLARAVLHAAENQISHQVDVLVARAEAMPATTGFEPGHSFPAFPTFPAFPAFPAFPMPVHAPTPEPLTVSGFQFGHVALPDTLSSFFSHQVALFHDLLLA